MVEDSFLKRKKDVLSKLDKSSKGEWDEKILQLCEKINDSDNYYTTSSCSGRVVLIVDEDKKQEGLFVKIYHDKISLEDLKKDLTLVLGKNEKIKFKMESCILHVVCKSLEGAQILYDKAKLAGWKKSGIIATKNHVVLELNSTERLEFPIMCCGKILVNDEFLKIIVKETNKKLEKSWKKIGKFMKLNYQNIFKEFALTICIISKLIKANSLLVRSLRSI